MKIPGFSSGTRGRENQMSEYTWKCGVDFASNTEVKTNKPLGIGKVVIDLLDGSRYRVDAIFPAKPNDREWSTMPDTVVHTWPAGHVSEDDLTRLRARAGYKVHEFSAPLESIVFDV
jgi:hypothetical protein